MLRDSLSALFARPVYLEWYCTSAACGDLDPCAAVEDFLYRAKDDDISPVRFFDPGWFRSKYRADGANAFLSYFSNERQRLAWPSPLFAPRWYSRRNRLCTSEQPLIHFLRCREEQSPHPLLDVAYLKEQAVSWDPGAIALAFLTDTNLHRLKPHPLFESDWYLDVNPDVAAAKMNPLEHYLYFGNQENRAPNRIFNIAWYKDSYLNPYIHEHAARREPLTFYLDHPRKHMPAPGLNALTRTAAKLTEHGSQLVIECIEKRQNIYSAIRFRPQVPAAIFRQYMVGNHY